MHTLTNTAPLGVIIIIFFNWISYVVRACESLQLHKIPINKKLFQI